MSDGNWVRIGDSWLNLGEAQQIDITEEDESEGYTLTITWSIDRSKDYALDSESKRDDIVETFEDLLDPEELDVEETDVDVSFL